MRYQDETAGAIPANARRRLMMLYVGALLLTVLVSIGHGFSEDWARDEWVKTNTIAAVVVAPPLIFFAYALVSRAFARCLAAIDAQDPEVKRRAIEEGLALPGRATWMYVGAWAIGQPLGLAVSLALFQPNRAELVSYVTDFLGLIPVAGFPIYAIVEAQLRPVLRELFKQTAGRIPVKELRIRKFSIPNRIGLAMGSLVFAILTFMTTKTIANAFGAGLDPHTNISHLLIQLPVFALMILMVGVSVTVSLRGSIAEVERTVRAAANGDLRRRAAITTTDELGRLMAGIDRMLAGQSGLIRSSVEVAGEVTMAASGVADGSDQAALGVAEIAHAMQEVVSGAQTQFEQIDSAREATEELRSAIEQAGSATEQANQIADAARELAAEGSSSAAQARDAMEEMQAAIGEAMEAVDRLGGDTADIGTIVDSIVTIAEQTNMLALNAAIEAARAGETGRGFAVVAEEVRQLASESNQAAEQIAGLIRKIKHTVTETVEAVNQGDDEVRRGVAVVDSAGRTFNDIAGAMTTIGERVGEVHARGDEVSVATDAVARAIDEILSVTQSVAALAEQTSANTEEASASSQEITSAADALRETARELERHISVFKV